MLPDSKITEIFFIIDGFSQVFDATIKEKSISVAKFIAINLVKCPKVRLPLFLYSSILEDIDV